MLHTVRHQPLSVAVFAAVVPGFLTEFCVFASPLIRFEPLTWQHILSGLFLLSATFIWPFCATYYILELRAYVERSTLRLLVELVIGVYLGTVAGRAMAQLVGTLVGLAAFEGIRILGTSVSQSYSVAFLCLLGGFVRLGELRRRGNA